MQMTFRTAYIIRKLYLIFLLNIADWICTVTLLGSGGFYEANPLMRPVIGNIAFGILFKGILPAGLVIMISRVLRRMDVGGLRRSDCFISFALTYYLGLCVIHIANFLLLFLKLGS